MKTYKRIKVYKLDDFSIDDIIENHEKAHLDYYGVHNASTKKFSKPTAYERKKLLYSILIHSIIRKCEESDNSIAILSSKYLKKNYRNDYITMLHNLEMLGIISCNNNYSIGNYSKGYSINNGIKFHLELVPSKDMKKELVAQQSKIEKQKREELQSIIDEKLTKKFSKRYETSLSHIKIIEPELAIKYVTNYPYPSESARNTRLMKIQDLEVLKDAWKIEGIDNNDRIYHVLTNCSRDLKPFLNIKFACDCHNSHPLLFNLNIISYYNLDAKTTNKIYEVIRDKNDIDLNNIKQTLIDGGISRAKISSIPADALLYIYLTSRGLFWDYMLLECCNSVNSKYNDVDITRGDIKIEMFAQVFYRKKLNNTTRKDTREKKFPLAALFKEKFPTVNKIVRNEKKKDNNPLDRKELPSNMMKAESKIYHEILEEIYKLNPKYKVFNIHDAIEVLDVKDNETLTIEKVKQVMEHVYRKNLLMPNLSIETQEPLDTLMFYLQSMNMCTRYRKSLLKTKAAEGNVQAIIYLYAINSGYMEYIWTNSSKRDVSLHMTDKMKNEEKVTKKNNTQYTNFQHDTTIFKKKVFHIMDKISNNQVLSMRGWLEYANKRIPEDYDNLKKLREDYELISIDNKDKTRYSFIVEVKKDNMIINTYRAIRKAIRYENRLIS